MAGDFPSGGTDAGPARADDTICDGITGSAGGWDHLRVVVRPRLAENHDCTALAPAGLADGYDAGFYYGVVAAELAEVTIPLAVLAWLATVQRLWRTWPILLTATISSAALSALLWHAVRAAADHLS